MSFEPSYRIIDTMGLIFARSFFKGELGAYKAERNVQFSKKPVKRIDAVETLNQLAEGAETLFCSILLAPSNYISSHYRADAKFGRVVW